MGPKQTRKQFRTEGDFELYCRGTSKAGYNPLVSKTDDDYIKSKLSFYTITGRLDPL
jgi:hypothetical protein